MIVRYDAESDAAYLQLLPETSGAKVAQTYPCDPSEVGGIINLDFDADGRLVGIEVLDASRLLPAHLLLRTK
jgi:uncharacterized protein YuzE